MKRIYGILEFCYSGVEKFVKRVLLLTGAPGIGKTTVLSKTKEALRAADVRVGGMISQEAREDGMRVGFEITDLTSGGHGWLAHVNQKTGPQVGKYRVNIGDIDRVGAKAISEATEKCAVVAIDEIGPMELYSPNFKQAVKDALDSGKVVLAVVHAKAQDLLINEAKQRADAELFTVTLANRNALPETLRKQVLLALN